MFVSNSHETMTAEVIYSAFPSKTSIKNGFAFSKMDIAAIDMLTRLEGMKVDG